MWVAAQDLPRSATHPFYARLNQILDQHDFDGYVEGLCERLTVGADGAVYVTNNSIFSGIGQVIRVVP